jgi:hypothetical protein
MGSALRFFAGSGSAYRRRAGAAQAPGDAGTPVRLAPAARAGADFSLLGSTNPFDAQRHVA